MAQTGISNSDHKGGSSAFHSLALFLFPPCLAFMVWPIVRYSPTVGFPSIPFKLGKHGFWTVLIITYVSHS